jgi:RNA polymerase sigma factor (sigma-70 family)
VSDVETREAMTLGERFDEVVAGARSGEEWALRAVYEELAPRVRGYLRGQGEAEPEELVGEVFLQVVRDFASFEGDESALRAWVLMIAHDRLVGERRRRSRRLSLSVIRTPREAETAGDAEEAVTEASEEERVNTMLGGLSASQRSVVLLRALGDLTVDQVADVLGKTPRAVERIQRRGLAALARQGETQPETEEGIGGYPEEADPDQRDRDAQRLTVERAADLAGLLDSVVDHARRLQRESETMIDVAEEAIAGIRAAAPAPPDLRPTTEAIRHEGVAAFGSSPSALEPQVPVGPRRERSGQRSVEAMSRRRTEARAEPGREEALLRATQMAIRGRARGEIEASLRDELGVSNAAEIVDQILGPERD